MTDSGERGGFHRIGAHELQCSRREAGWHSGPTGPRPVGLPSYRPLDAIQVALTRAILPQYGKQQVMPIMPPENERITLDQALKAYTLDAAYVLGLEKQIGSLRTGKTGRHRRAGEGPVQDSSRRDQHHEGEADHDEWQGDL